jgi:hypothetical protein
MSLMIGKSHTGGHKADGRIEALILSGRLCKIAHIEEPVDRFDRVNNR